MAKYNCSECGIELNQEGENVEACAAHPEADFNTTPFLSVQDAEAVIVAAKQTAKMFFEEFEEVLDPEATDWDSEAWANDSVRLHLDKADDSMGWELYQKTLVAETERLAGIE